MQRSNSEVDMHHLVDALEREWGLREGELDISGPNGCILTYKSAVELINRLLPLDVVAASTNVDEDNDSTDQSTYVNGSTLHDLLRENGDYPAATLTHVHSDLDGSRKRRLAQFGHTMKTMMEMVNPRNQQGEFINIENEPLPMREAGRARPNPDDLMRVSHLLEILYYAENVQHGIRHLMHLFSTGKEGMRTIPGVFSPTQMFGKRFRRTEEGEKKNSSMMLNDHLLDKLAILGFRRYSQSVMMPVIINGRYTYSWRRKCSIETFIWENINAYYDKTNYELATQDKGNISYAVSFLTKVLDHRFPDLVKERRIHSFRNAIYITSVMGEDGVFTSQSHTILFDDSQHPSEADPILSRMTEGGKVAACFHDCVFPFTRNADGSLIARPETFEKISTHQRWTEEVKEWFRAACGRMLHPIASTPSPVTLEKWQIFFMLLGVGNSGKSTTIDNVVYNFFDSEDVAYIQNNLEKQYGWSKCKNKYMWLAPEIKGDFATHCDQAQFQQVVEGGRLASAKKYAVETIEFDPFDLPGMMGANETIQFHDNGESVSRRQVDFWFGQPIMNVDPMMPEKLNAELGHIIYTCNEAYLRKTREVKSRIWDSLPEYFLDLRRENAANTNALEHFLQNGRLEYHPDYYMTATEFQRLYILHTRQHELGRKTLKKEYIQGPFQKRQMVQEKKTLRCPIEKTRKNCVWVLGVRSMQDDAFDDEEPNPNPA